MSKRAQVQTPSGKKVDWEKMGSGTTLPDEFFNKPGRAPDRRDNRDPAEMGEAILRARAAERAQGNNGSVPFRSDLS